jgi:hypothetical protein
MSVRHCLYELRIQGRVQAQGVHLEVINIKIILDISPFGFEEHKTEIF